MTERDAPEARPDHETDPGEVAPLGESEAPTVGTGSAIGVGCLILVVVLVLAALAYRWLGGTW